MSWGVQAVGYAPTVRKLIADHVAAAKPCPEIEEQIRLAAAKLVDLTLSTYDPQTVVQVDCRGSLCHANWETEEGRTQVVILHIDPVHQFLDPEGVKCG